MPLSGSAFWAVIVPVGDRANLLLNPDFERGTAGAAAIQSATLGSAANVQQFGAWSLSVAPNSNGTSGAALGTWTAGNGTDYTVSAYVRGVNGVPYMLGVGDSSGLNLVGSTAFTGGGTWQRYSYAFTESAGAVRRLVVRKTSGNDTGTYYVDGQQAEAGSLTTFISGDLDGCYWTGVPHASQSVRSGTYRGGGSVVALADLGLKPDDAVGIGMPPQDITSQSYALLPGAEYQRSRAAERPFNITFKPILGTTLQGFHVTRRTLINALKPDLLDPQQPVRFWYTGGQGTVQIDAVYAGGLELGQMDGPMAEAGAIKFIAHDPYWYATTQEGTALAPRTALGSANFIVKRDPFGRWGTMGQSGTTFQTVSSANGGVFDLLYTNGTLFTAGSWGTAGGTKAPNIAMYFPDTNAWGTLGPGTIVQAGPILSAAYSPWGSLYFGGFLNTVAGTAAPTVAQWNGGGFGTLTGGTVGTSANGRVQTILLAAGTLFITGPGLTSFGGTAGTILGMWSRGTWGTLTNGSVNGVVSALAFGKDNKLYTGGVFTAAGGTAANRVASWDGTWGTMSGGMDQSVFALGVQPNAQIIAGGLFGTAGAGSANAVAAWNGQQFFPLGSGIINTTSVVFVGGMYVDQSTSDVYAVGIFNFAGGQRVPDGAARWNGYTWLPMDIDVAGANSGTVTSIEIAPDRTLFMGGTWMGTAQAAAVAQVYNTGMGDAYPIVRVRATGAGTVRVYQLVNTYPTGDGLYFNLILQPQEEVILTTEPGNRSLTSDFRGNVISSILPGSNLASFRLTNGTNYISLFADSDSVAASIYWQARSDSVDGGTIV